MRPTRCTVLLALVAVTAGMRPASSSAQTEPGFIVAERPDGPDGVSRSYVSTDALGTTFEYLPSLFWRCVPLEIANGDVLTNIELGMLVDELTAPGRIAGVQWRFDSEAPVGFDGWGLSSDGSAVLAPPRDRDAFTEAARSAEGVLVRVTDDVGAFDTQFALGGLAEALARLPCSDAFLDPADYSREPEPPTFIPFAVPPSIINRDEVLRAMQREYPPDLRELGIGGRVVVYFFVDERGYVTESRLSASSGQHELDAAALRVARVYRFRPAQNDDGPVAVWVQFPVTFSVRR